MDYHGDRFQDNSLMVYKDDELIALFPANRSAHTLHSHQGLTYGGLVLSPKSKFPDAVGSFQSVLQYAVDTGIRSLEIKSLPAIYPVVPSDELDYLAFKLNAETIRCDLLSVIEPKSLNYSRDRKNGVKRGQKHDLIVKEETSFESFWNQLLIPNLEEKFNKKPVHSLKEITLLKSKFPNKIRQFNVYLPDGTLVAGTTIFETKKVAHSQYISGDDNKNTLGSLDFLHDYLLKRTFRDKAYFDFGISNEDDGQVFNDGLLYWKEGFGARSVAHKFYRFDPLNYKELSGIFI